MIRAVCDWVLIKTMDSKGFDELPWLAILYYHILWPGVCNSMGRGKPQAFHLDPSWILFDASLPSANINLYCFTVLKLLW